MISEINEIMWGKFPNGGSPPSPLLDVYLSSNFGMPNTFYKKGKVISDQVEHLKMFSFGEKIGKTVFEFSPHNPV